MGGADHRDTILTIDLDGVAANYRKLAGKIGRAQLAAVVKADAYGLGVEPVSQTLAQAGCKDFFVATLGEAIQLRQILPGAGVHVLNGLPAGSAPEMTRHGLVPVLNSLGEVEEWSAHCAAQDYAGTADLHIDSGLTRLGLDGQEVERLATGAGPDFQLDCLLSHLACADELGNPMKGRHRGFFRHLFGPRISSGYGPRRGRHFRHQSDPWPTQPHGASHSITSKNPANPDR